MSLGRDEKESRFGRLTSPDVRRRRCRWTSIDVVGDVVVIVVDSPRTVQMVDVEVLVFNGRAASAILSCGFMVEWVGRRGLYRAHD